VPVLTINILIILDIYLVGVYNIFEKIRYKKILEKSRFLNILCKGANI